MGVGPAGSVDQGENQKLRTELKMTITACQACVPELLPLGNENSESFHESVLLEMAH